MTSSRLPGKVMLPAAGKPMLGHLVDRLKTVPSIDRIVIATTVNQGDEPIVEFAEQNSIGVSRGSEDDVMSRVLQAAETHAADTIVEITGDCPIIDPDIVEQVIRTFQANDVDYVGNVHVRSYPDGMDTQVFTLSALRKSASMTDDPLDREHVSLHIRNHPEIFSALHLVAPPFLHYPELGLTLDEAGDYELLKKITETLAPEGQVFGCGDVLSLLQAHPEWIELNRHVVRKGDN